MRPPSAIPNPLQEFRNDIRLALGGGEGDHYVVRPALLPEVDPIDREHVTHGFDVGCLLGVGPKHDEVHLILHQKIFPEISTPNHS